MRISTSRRSNRRKPRWRDSEPRRKKLIDGELEQCALFDAGATDAGGAVEMVNQGEAVLIESNLYDGPPQAAMRKA